MDVYINGNHHTYKNYYQRLITFECHDELNPDILPNNKFIAGLHGGKVLVLGNRNT